MPYCFVPNCTSGSASKNKYLEENGLPKPRCFTAGSEERQKIWEQVIKRGDRSMSSDSRVCSDHFTENDYQVEYATHTTDGQVVKIPRGKAKLIPNAVPSPKAVKRTAPKPRKNSSPKKKKYSQVLPDIAVSDMEPVNEPPPVIENIETEDKQNADANAQLTATKDWSCSEVKNLQMPINSVVCNTIEESSKFIVHIDPINLETTKTIIFKDNEPPVVKIRNNIAPIDTPEILSSSAAQELLVKVDKIKICPGTGIGKHKFSEACGGMLESKTKRCQHCIFERARLRKREERKSICEKRKEAKIKKRKSNVQSLKRSKINLLNKVHRYKFRVENAIRECEKKNEVVLAEAISQLPSVAQQEAVRACFEASKRKGPSGRRYTVKWVYECMLMRIKDKNLYNHIRRHEILVLPNTTTINRYLKHYGGTYGFQPQILEMLKKKKDQICQRNVGEVRMILIDEMKLSKGLYFDSSTLQVLGCKDMGEDIGEAFGEDFRENVEEAIEQLPVSRVCKEKIPQGESSRKPKNDREKNLGDHALVISFQPFRDKWVQAIACFLTNGNASDSELTKLILEAVLLLERSGLFVDGVVGDGAAWNRSMWKKFGISYDNCSAEHPCDPERQLYFISDFPHLMKCKRNCLCSKKIIKTPEGDVRLAHWEGVLEADSLHKIGLRECHRLTKDHINPDPWQKMNVAMAWQFWSASVAASMECYRLQGVEKLEDCSASANLCKMINDLADAMNSSTPQTALRLNSVQYQAITSFLEYFIKLKDWANEKLRAKLRLAEEARVAQAQAKGQNPRGKSAKTLEKEDYIFSDSTDIGLIVSLKGTIQLVKFLIGKCHFQYVMTARLNQDALERFFGLVRQSSWANTHPEPRVFIQLFRLLSIYSLVKPCRGSNITGGEMITTLLSLDDLKTKTRVERQQALQDKLDEIILNGQNLESVSDVIEQIEHDHDYIGEGESVDEFALSYVAGFVARHSKKYAKDCQECNECLIKKEEEKTDVDMLITLKSKGYLTYPSDILVNLLRTLEKSIIHAAMHNEMEENILFLVLDKVATLRVENVGCELHSAELTKSIIKFYTIMRMHFLRRKWNEITTEMRKKQKAHRKQANLVDQRKT
ncbi:Transposable element P transposase [Frankliniella fusca]|uniref:Transposable element P transposase n=1 Tax=Frankliniella fusca TaxID=407009 RepID=A0AAE1IXX7_9NEOP|nr:Transposable element P transposase [Frankliniella fusca]